MNTSHHAFGAPYEFPRETEVRTEYYKAGDFTMRFQTDGNVVIYDGNGTPTWATGSAASEVPVPGDRLIFQTDGNLVLYGAPDANGECKVVWTTSTYGHPNALLILQTDGNLVIYDPYPTVAWASNGTTPKNPGGSTKLPEQSKYGSEYGVLAPGTYPAGNTWPAMSSPVLAIEQSVTLDFTAGGQLQVAEVSGQDRTVPWSQPPAPPNTPGELTFGADGSLVLTDGEGLVLWQTDPNKDGNQHALLFIQNDGNVCVYNPYRAGGDYGIQSATGTKLPPYIAPPPAVQ